MAAAKDTPLPATLGELELRMQRLERAMFAGLNEPLPDEAGLRVLALVPDRATLGSPSFTLHVRGTGFTAESVIVWNGAPEATTYVSPTEVSTGVNMATAGVAMTLGVEVQTGAVLSNTLPFTFEAPA